MGILSRLVFQILAGVTIGLLFGILIIGWTSRARQVASAAPTDIPVMINGTPTTDCKRTQWPATSLAITPGVIVAKPGDTFAIQVTINTAAVSQGIQFGLTFDPRLLEYVSASEGSFYKDWAKAHGISTVFLPSAGVDPEKGRLKTLGIAVLDAAQRDGVTGTGLIGTIQLRARAGASGQSTLMLDELMVVAPDLCGNPAAVDPVSVSGATVVVGGGSAPSATPSPQLVSPPTPPGVPGIKK